MSTEGTPVRVCTSFPAPGLRPIARHITTHTTEGKGTFFSEDMGAHHRVIQGGLGVANILYSTRSNPVDLTDDTDIALAAEAEPPLHYREGSVVRMVDFAPGAESSMHRSLSIDYGVVVEGEFDFELEGGETRIIRRGDVCVNRGAAHVWRNRSQTESGRMMWVLLDIGPLFVGGEKVEGFMGALETDYAADV